MQILTLNRHVYTIYYSGAFVNLFEPELKQNQSKFS